MSRLILTCGKAFLLYLAALIGFACLGGACAGVSAMGVPFAIPLVLQLAIFLCWLCFAYGYYRSLRREELLQVIISTVDSNMPIIPALRAYLDDRPRGGNPILLPFLLLFVVVCPFVLFPVAWIQNRRFDRRVRKLIELVENGVPLSHAMNHVPGVASWETQLTVFIREREDRETPALDIGDRESYSIPWLEILPRLIYVPFVILFMFAISMFSRRLIIPKYEKIYQDFRVPLPEITRSFFHVVGLIFDDYALLYALLMNSAIAILALVVVSPSVRWRFPLVGRCYRRQMQGRVLRLLGISVKTGLTIPDALELMIDFGIFPWAVNRRLHRTLDGIENGEALETSLNKAGLLPKSMVPLVGVSVRLRTLGDTLIQLGDFLAASSVTFARRTSLLIAPISVAAAGVLVVLFCMAMFLPLVHFMKAL